MQTLIKKCKRKPTQKVNNNQLILRKMIKFNIQSYTPGLNEKRILFHDDNLIMPKKHVVFVLKAYVNY